MNVLERIQVMDRQAVDDLLHTALCRLAFVRHTDAEVELNRLLEPFNHYVYKRSPRPFPPDHEVGSWAPRRRFR